MVQAEIVGHCPLIVKLGGGYIFLDIYLGVARLDYVKVKHVEFLSCYGSHYKDFFADVQYRFVIRDQVVMRY